MPEKLHGPAIDEVGLFGKEVGVVQSGLDKSHRLQGVVLQMRY